MNRRLITACAVIVALLGIQPAFAQASPVPRFEGAGCPFKVDKSLTAGKDVRCGYLIVPENRTLTNGKTIRLAVAIVKSPSAHPAPDPTIFLAGGPGQSALGVLGQPMTASLRQVFAPDRDFILIDQRGTGYSQPSLSCPALPSSSSKLPAKPPTLSEEEKSETQGVARCRDYLVQKGVDLSAYNSVENARDIADLRVALGYDEVNLYGGSYGTRLALSVMRYAPEGIRSVVLDAVYGPSINLFTDTQRAAARIFRMVFDDCAKSSTCAKRNPNLGKAFRSVVTNLDRKPVKLTLITSSPRTQKVWLTGEALLTVVYSTLYNAGQITNLRHAVSEASHGRYRALAILIGSMSSGTAVSSEGMFLSVSCSEDAAGTTRANVTAAAQSLPTPFRKDFSARWLRILHDCQIWNVPAVAPTQKQPVVSDIPTMIMQGEYDPITPPQYGAAVATTLSSSFSFLYPGIGHGSRYTDQCPYTMAQAFVEEPTSKPADTCIHTMTRP